MLQREVLQDGKGGDGRGIPVQLTSISVGLETTSLTPCTIPSRIALFEQLVSLQV
jgi:hypothetical protein